MELNKTPMNTCAGFDYTEDFDGIQVIGNSHLFYNFKNVVGCGGAQTRTMREVFHFIEAQCKVLNTLDDNSVYLYDDTFNIINDVFFVNILDGDVIESKLDNFNYVFNFYPLRVRERIYVGSNSNYKKWFSSRFNQVG